MRTHLVGIGGTGMSALAMGLIARGDEVSGCDWKESETTRALRGAGVNVAIGHDVRHVNGQDLVTYTEVVRAGMVEVEAARRRGISILTRPAALAELIASTRSVAVAGTHGKTTVTAMLGHVLSEAGWDPTVLVADGIGSRAGGGGWLVAEADESDGSLVLHHPRWAVVTNVEHDHPDHFPTLADVRACFQEFLDGLPASSLAVLCADDPNLREMASPARRVTYGFGAADYSCTRERPSRLSRRGRRLGTLRISSPGWHNLQDACGVAAAALELGVGFDVVAGALATFPGAHRRLERLGRWRGADVYDDYGHHPSEIRATLEAARELTRGRLVLLFQPHRFTRFTAFEAAFAASFDGADETIVTEIYP
ncbi:MAG: UDP-N-acetylmuramate--L-alanine ligase, partial [Candidatus Dormibacteraceae bacterium]